MDRLITNPICGKTCLCEIPKRDYTKCFVWKILMSEKKKEENGKTNN